MNYSRKNREEEAKNRNYKDQKRRAENGEDVNMYTLNMAQQYELDSIKRLEKRRTWQEVVR